MQTNWNLRFHNAALEQDYLAYIVKRDNLMSRLFVLLASLVVVATFPLNLEQLPANTGPDELIARLIAFAPFCVGCIYLFHQKRFAHYMPWMMLGCTMYGTAVLNYGQWLFWNLGSMQSMLGVVIVAPMLGCMPWRLGVFASIWAALVLIVPEILFQDNPVLRNMRIAYILFSAAIGAMTAYVQEYHSRLQFLVNNRFQQQSRMDQLTSLPNRRELSEVLPRLLRQAAREKVGLAVAMLDVDHFKMYNDHYGHAAGDRVLAAVGQALRERSMQRPDFVARYGGEEFVAVWFNPTHKAHALGEGLRRAVEALRLPHAFGGESKQVSISVGVAWLNKVLPGQGNTRELLALADRCLYTAKGKGRNCVCVEQVSEAVLQQCGPQSIDEQASQEENALGVQDVQDVSREDYWRWYFGRGFMERRQLQWKAGLAIIIGLVQLLIVHFTMPADEARVFLWVQGGASMPLIVASYLLLHINWTVRNVQRIGWGILLPHGLMMIYVLHHAQQHNYTIPYDFLLIIIFQVYFSGASIWGYTALCGWLLSVVYMFVVYQFGGPMQVQATIIPFIIANLVGMVTAYTQDRRSRDIFFKKEQLEKLASHDPLTGLANRHGLTNYVNNQLSVLPGAGHPVTVAMIDIDHFKKYNDHYGHEAGDKVLMAVGRVLSDNALRAYDLAVRLGGEEFAVIWYRSNPTEATVLGQRICDGVRALNIPHEKSEFGIVTVCIGLTHGELPTHNGGMAQLETLLREADEALYRAKEAGRNCVIPATDGLIPENA